MGPQSASDYNNLGLMLLESNCLIPARKALEDAKTVIETKQLPKRRVYSTEAPPRRPGTAVSSWAVMEFSEITTTPSSRTFLERVRVLSFPRTLVVIRLIPKCPFTPAVVLYNLAMVYLAESRICSSPTKAEQAKALLDRVDLLLKKWTVCLFPKAKEKPAVLRACLMLRLMVLSKLGTLFNSPVLMKEIQGIHIYLANHDLSNSLQSLESSSTYTMERLEI